MPEPVARAWQFVRFVIRVRAGADVIAVALIELGLAVGAWPVGRLRRLVRGSTGHHG